MYKIFAFIFLLSANKTLIAEPIHFIVDSKSFQLFFESDKKPTNMHQATYKLIFEEIEIPPKISLIPSLRIERFLDSVQPTCTFYHLQTPERTEKYIFSSPTDIFLGVRLYQHKSTSPINDKFLDQNGHLLSVSDFFNDKSTTSRLLLMSGKSYGYELDKQIDNINPASKVNISGESATQAFLNMFFKKRVDYIIYYPTAFPQSKTELEALRSYPINGSPPYVFGRLMCNNTDTTQAFITHVNKILKRLYLTDKFLNAILDFTPETEHEHIKHIIHTEFIPESLEKK